MDSGTDRRSIFLLELVKNGSIFAHHKSKTRREKVSQWNIVKPAAQKKKKKKKKNTEREGGRERPSLTQHKYRHKVL